MLTLKEEVPGILPFHEWKDRQVKLDGFFHPKDWYFTKYGEYCERVRREYVKDQK